MAKTIKLPADLRDWKVTSFVEEDNGCEVYKVSRKIDKNTAQNAILRHAFVGKSNYTDERAEYFTEECYDFFEDVCTINELLSLSQRFEVAKMLMDKRTYLDISEKTGASTATISRVNRSLNYGNDGYDMVFERIGLTEKEEDSSTAEE